MIADGAAASWKRMHSRWGRFALAAMAMQQSSSRATRAPTRRRIYYCSHSHKRAAADLSCRVDDISVVILDIDFTRPWTAGMGGDGADGEESNVLFAF